MWGGGGGAGVLCLLPMLVLVLQCVSCLRCAHLQVVTAGKASKRVKAEEVRRGQGEAAAASRATGVTRGPPT